MPEGKIVKILPGAYFVESAGEVIACRARGIFRNEGITPLVGDRVEIENRGGGLITRVLPRDNEFVRPPVANVGVMVIVASGAIPVTAPFLIDRMVLTAERAGCEPFIAVNKTDLAPARELCDTYARAGFSVFSVSALTGEGVTELLGALAGSVSALEGNSGVGKTSLLRAMGLGDLPVGEVSEKLGRGRHTTRHLEMHTLPGGAFIIDTPGFSSFEAADRYMPADEIASYFRDFAPYLGECRFRDCAHKSEPGCAVRAAVGTDIAPSRYDSYLRLLDISAELKANEYK